MLNKLPYLKIENISKFFLTRKIPLEVLRNINFEVKEAEFVSIVGPSGCGKTTLLNIISGLEEADAGRILRNGQPLSGTGPDRLVIFQDLGLFPWLTVQKNVEFGLKIKKLSQDERKKIALDYLKTVNLAKFKDSFIHELSGGMKQRVALARALALDPQILLMDEPFTALDAQTRDILHVELQQIWSRSKKTILFVTHNVREAVCLGDKVIVLSAAPASIKNIFDVNLKRPRHIEDPGLIEIARMILAELRSEIEKVFKKEINDKENT
ncbi:MAG: ABC transporter ATP-binding protein [Deltaproteobacteria bacterium]